MFLRIDVIEQVLRDAFGPSIDIWDSGYRVAYAVAESNLRAGLGVVADSVNPIEASREAWRAVAARSGIRALEVEIICSDQNEHRRRLDSRTVDVSGLEPPTWEEVVAKPYEPWSTADLVIDTMELSAEGATAEIMARAQAARP